MLRPYEPTWKEQIAAYLMGNARPSPERRQFATGISDILGYLPGVGNVLQGQEAARAGDTKGTIMAMLPIPGANVAAKTERNIAQGIRAYHGSPHDFPAFDFSKIGTGEGVQAYGRGGYFAGHEPVAISYRDRLSGDDLLLDNKLLFDRQGNQHFTTGNDYIDDIVGEYGGDIEGAIRQQNLYKDHLASMGESVSHVDDVIRSLEKLRGRISKTGNKGHMYEVNIKADPEHFLDWDRPLNEQSQTVRDAVRSLPYGQEDWIMSAKNPMLALEDARSAWMQRSGMDTRGYQNHRDAVSKDLANVKLPGIKYFDADSRAAGEGSRNYVVFDDKIVEIMRKYGLMGPIGAGIAAKILERQQQRQEM
jgi:hypothetical protein